MNEENQEYNKSFDKEMWKKVIKYILIHKKVLLLLISSLVILSGLESITPLLTRYAIDTYIESGSTANMGWFIIVYFIVILIKASSIFALIYLAEKLFLEVSHSIRKDAFEKLQKLSFTYYDNNTVGSLIARVTSDTWRLTGIISWGLVDLFWGIFTILTVTILMFILNVKITLAVLGVIPLLLLISIYFQKKILKSTRESRKYNSAITASFNEGIQGATTTKTLVREKKNLEEFDVKTEKFKSAAIKIAVLSALFFPIVSALGILGTSLALWTGGVMVFGGIVTIGTLSAFISYTQLFFFPINDLARIFANFQMAQAAGERVFTLLDANIDIYDHDEVLKQYGLIKASDTVPKLHGQIEFKNVSFKYTKGEQVLKNFNLKVEKGQSIAIVGETGSGKTTIVNLACRFYQPTVGEILIDGINYQDIPLMHVQGNLGYMLQTPHLFSGTIKDNITYGNLEATYEEVENAAKLAEAHGFIMNFEKGYDHAISKGGGGLSTGQKQLICIARAIIANPSIFILDEATSSVDTHTEKAIQQAIGNVIKDRTSFIIAHRLSTIRQADRILVLDKGNVIEEGTHNELIALEGHYYKLYTSQFLEEQELEILN
ncbi:MAG: ABC transporter ATP-binding protein [Clostridiales bacterium]|nr:ABC transporter ATP-binding protein [Clostridiales bacterium]